MEPLSHAPAAMPASTRSASQSIVVCVLEAHTAVMEATTAPPVLAATSLMKTVLRPALRAAQVGSSSVQGVGSGVLINELLLFMVRHVCKFDGIDCVFVVPCWAAPKRGRTERVR